MSHHHKSFKWLFIGIPLVVLITSTALAKKPPKDDDPPPEPDPVPVEYQIHWIDDWASPDYFASRLGGLNDNGVAVGRFEYGDRGSGGYRAWRWSQSNGVEFMDDLSDSWIDLNLNPEQQQVSGWFATGAHEINNAGQIVGNASNNSETYSRAFLFDPDYGFFLLPTQGTGNYYGYGLNADGDVMLHHTVNGDYGDSKVFFWTSLVSDALTLVANGETFGWDIRSRMNGTHFLTGENGSNNCYLYSYSVAPDGTFSCVRDFGLPASAVRFGNMSDNSLLPFADSVTEKVRGKWVTSFNAAVYDILTGQTKTIGKTMALADIGLGASAANNGGDATYRGDDLMGRIYRASEDMSYRFYDLLSAEAKAALYIDGLPRDLSYDVGSPYTLINDSNVAGVPVDDPFDHVASMTSYMGTGDLRTYVLVPVELP